MCKVYMYITLLVYNIKCRHSKYPTKPDLFLCKKERLSYSLTAAMVWAAAVRRPPLTSQPRPSPYHSLASQNISQHQHSLHFQLLIPSLPLSVFDHNKNIQER